MEGEVGGRRAVPVAHAEMGEFPRGDDTHRLPRCGNRVAQGGKKPFDSGAHVRIGEAQRGKRSQDRDDAAGFGRAGIGLEKGQLELDGVFRLMRDVLLEEFRRERLEPVQDVLVRLHHAQRRFKILIGDGKGALQARVGGADDHEDVRLPGFLQFLVGPGINRSCLLEVVGRGHEPLDEFPLVF